MTEFRQHDRLRVVNDKRRGVDAEKVLKKGQIVTAASVKDNTVILKGIEGWWFSNRFDLVEHAVDEDANTKPLYAGDRVMVVYPGSKRRECLVESGEKIGSWVTVYPVGGGIATNAPRSTVTLLRHHWEHPILGFDGTTAEGNPFVIVGYMDDGGAMKIHPPRPDVELIKQMEAQIRRWNHLFWGYAVPPQSNHALGNAVDVPVQLNWDDVVIGSVVQVRVRATGEEFTAEVTESPNGTKKGQEPSPHVHGIWTGTSIVRKCWELLRNDLPVKTWADGSVILLGLSGTARREMHRIKGTWIDAMTGKTWADTLVATYSYQIVRDAEKES